MAKKRYVWKLVTELLHNICILFLVGLTVILEAGNPKNLTQNNLLLLYLLYFTLLAKSRHKNKGLLLLRKVAFAVRLFQLFSLCVDIAAYESFPLLLPALQAKQVKDWKTGRI